MSLIQRQTGITSMPKHEPHSTHSCLLLPVSPHTEQYTVAQAKTLESPLTSPLLWIPTSPVPATIPSCLGYFNRLQTHLYAFTHPSPRRPQGRLLTGKLDWVTPWCIPSRDSPHLRSWHPHHGFQIQHGGFPTPQILASSPWLPDPAWRQHSCQPSTSCPDLAMWVSSLLLAPVFVNEVRKRMRNQYWRWKGKYRGS